MTGAVKRRRRTARERVPLSPAKLAALRALVACPGCGAVRQPSAEGTTITHTRRCTAPPEHGPA